MNLSEWIRLIYGLTMGTSTPLIDPGKRHLEPLKFLEISDSCELYIGGAANGAILKSNSGLLLINSNMGQCAETLYEKYSGQVKSIICQRAHNYFASGNYLFPEVGDVYVGAHEPLVISKTFGERRPPNHILREQEVITWGKEKIEIHPIAEDLFFGNLVVYLTEAKALFLGDFFYNRVHPVIRGFKNKSNFISTWINLLDSLVSKFQPKHIIPAEGMPASPDRIREFIEYLKDVSVTGVKVSELGGKYKDWKEIPGLSSLEESVERFK